MRAASRVGAIAVAAVLMVGVAPGANAEDAPPVVYLLSWPSELSKNPNPVFTFTSTATGFPPDSITCQLDGAASFDCSMGYVPLNGLAEGAHSFVITPADSRGPGESLTVPWTIDLTAPDTSASATAWTNYFGAGVTMSSSDTDVSYFECAVGAGAFSPCSFRYPEGLVALKVRAVDRAGNADPTPAEVTFTVENAPPETTATVMQHEPNGPFYVDIFFGSSDSDSGVATVACHMEVKTFSDGLPLTYDIYRDDATSCAQYSRPWYIEGDTEVTITATATDAAGNVDPTPAQATWIRDTTPPVVRIDTGPGSPIPSSTASFTVSATDAHHHLLGSGVDHFECWLDSDPAETCSATPEFTDLADGNHVFTVIAVDTQGNRSIPNRWTWTSDTDPPLSGFTSVPPTFDSHDSGQLDWVVIGGPATSVCSLDGGAEASCSSPFVYTDLAEGQHTLFVRSTDQAGNAEPAGATHSWTVDTIPPTVSILGKPDALTNDPIALFVFEVAGASGLECTLDSAVVACSSAPEYTVADGDHTFSVVAFDQAGNRSPAATHAWTVDTVAPSVLIVGGPDALTSDSVAEFGFAITGGSDLECTLDGDVVPCALTQTFTVADGAHTLSVVAIDEAGNRSDAAARTWTVDTIAPTVAITTSPDALTTDPVASFVFEVTGATDVECTLDGVVAACSPTESFTVADSEHSLSVVAIDEAGNRSDAASHSWTVDTVSPETVFSVTPGAVSGGSVTFEFAAPSPDAARAAFAVAAVDVVFECSLDGDDFESCESPVTVSGLGDGVHTFAVRGVDAAGNVESSPATYSWVVSAPVAAVVPAAALAATGLVPLPVAAASVALLIVGGVLLFTRRQRAFQ